MSWPVRINKQKVRNRIEQLKIPWQQFVEIRERFVKDGVPRQEAWERTALVFLEADFWTPKLDPRIPDLGDNQAPGPVAIPVAEESQPAETEGNAPASVFINKAKANIRRDILWVYENLHLTGVRAKNAPSGGAWGLLVWARKTSANEASFITQILSKVISKDDDEKDSRMEDDDRTAADLISQIRRIGPDSVHTPVSERVGDEPGVSPSSPDRGGVLSKDAAKPVDMLQT
jgi:hypothetical protein